MHEAHDAAHEAYRAALLDARLLIASGGGGRDAGWSEVPLPEPLPSPFDQWVSHIEQGTTARQRVFPGTLEGLPQIVAAQDVHAPTLVIVGDVVRLREKLAWFAPSDPR